MSNKFKTAIAKFRAFPRRIRWSTYAISSYLFYAALLGLLVPYIAKQQIPEQVSKLRLLLALKRLEFRLTFGNLFSMQQFQLNISH
jgi:hypothetical protein